MTGIGATIAHIVFQPPGLGAGESETSEAPKSDNLRKWIEDVGWPSLAAVCDSPGHASARA